MQSFMAVRYMVRPDLIFFQFCFVADIGSWQFSYKRAFLDGSYAVRIAFFNCSHAIKETSLTEVKLRLHDQSVTEVTHSILPNKGIKLLSFSLLLSFMSH